MSESPTEPQILQNQVDTLRAQEKDLIDRIDNAGRTLLMNSFPVFAASGLSAEITSTLPLAQNNLYAPLTLQYQTIMYAYKTQSILQNAIDMPVQDALRGGLDFQSDELDKDDLKELTDYLDKTSFYQQVKILEQWARLFGGAAMLINTEQDPATPLSMGNLFGRKLSFIPVARWELNSTARYSDYYVWYGQRFHRSRVLTVAGKEAPFQIKWILQNWGLSEFEKLNEPFNIYLRTQNAIYDLLKEAKVDIFKFKGFLSQLTSSAGTQRAIQRVQLMNQAKGTNNALMLDGDDDYEQKVMSFAGLAEMSLQNRINLASATRIPLNKLFGTGATGFSSGEDDIENYNAMVESEIREHLKPTMRTLIDIVAMNVFGQEMDLAFEFKPLRVMSSDKEEEIKTKKHARYMADAMAGFLSPQEYMQLQQKEKLLPIECEVARGADPTPMMKENPEERDANQPKDKKEGAKKVREKL